MSEKQNTSDRVLLTEKETALRFRISRQTLWRMRDAGLPFYRANSKILYDAAQVEGFMSRGSQTRESVAA